MTGVQKIKVDGTTIAYRESGSEGPAAILVHGNSSGGRAFANQTRAAVGATGRLRRAPFLDEMARK